MRPEAAHERLRGEECAHTMTSAPLKRFGMAAGRGRELSKHFSAARQPTNACPHSVSV
jgi:hypothetical protein